MRKLFWQMMSSLDEHRVRLKLEKTQTLGSGVVILTYEPASR